MNTYSTTFFGRCPANGIRISYTLQIATNITVAVEEILNEVENLDDKFHEQIADILFAKFGGTQTLIANHHGVTIETLRKI